MVELRQCFTHRHFRMALALHRPLRCNAAEKSNSPIAVSASRCMTCIFGTYFDNFANMWQYGIAWFGSGHHMHKKDIQIVIQADKSQSFACCGISGDDDRLFAKAAMGITQDHDSAYVYFVRCCPSCSRNYRLYFQQVYVRFTFQIVYKSGFPVLFFIKGTCWGSQRQHLPMCNEHRNNRSRSLRVAVAYISARRDSMRVLLLQVAAVRRIRQLEA